MPTSRRTFLEEVSFGVPVVANLVFGHVTDKATLPLGVMAELDGDAGTLTLLEPAVR